MTILRIPKSILKYSRHFRWTFIHIWLKYDWTFKSTMSKVKKINKPNHMQNISSARNCFEHAFFLNPVIMNDWQHHRKSTVQMCGIPDLHDQDKRVDLACVWSSNHFTSSLYLTSFVTCSNKLNKTFTN